MATMRTMTDCNGNEVPIQYVSKYDKARDTLARKIRARFERARQNLQKVLTDSLADIEAFKRAQKIDGGARGNFQFSSFDGLSTVSIDQSYQIKLDERVSTARQMMLDYACKISGQVDDGTDAAALSEIIKAAFAASRSGMLPYTKILTLIKLNIKAVQWQEARQILIESIQPVKGRSYLRCSIKKDHQSNPVNIKLDLADCDWPAKNTEA